MINFRAITMIKFILPNLKKKLYILFDNYITHVKKKMILIKYYNNLYKQLGLLNRLYFMKSELTCLRVFIICIHCIILIYMSHEGSFYEYFINVNKFTTNYSQTNLL